MKAYKLNFNSNSGKTAFELIIAAPDKETAEYLKGEKFRGARNSMRSYSGDCFYISLKEEMLIQKNYFGGSLKSPKTFKEVPWRSEWNPFLKELDEYRKRAEEINQQEEAEAQERAERLEFIDKLVLELSSLKTPVLKPGRQKNAKAYIMFAGEEYYGFKKSTMYFKNKDIEREVNCEYNWGSYEIPFLETNTIDDAICKYIAPLFSKYIDEIKWLGMDMWSNPSFEDAWNKHEDLWYSIVEFETEVSEAEEYQEFLLRRRRD